MADIPLTNKLSPRFENGTWKWYKDNTFSLLFQITLKKNGQYITAEELVGSTITVEFFDKNKNLVKVFEFSNLQFSGQTHIVEVYLLFTENVSKLFDVGKYTYCIKFNEYTGTTLDGTVTIYGNGKAEVELCH